MNNAATALLEKLDLQAISRASELDHISLLQELCKAHRWKYPNYEFQQLKHNKVDDSWYTVVCSLWEFKSIGEKKIKEEAQRQAARLMYDQIIDNSRQKGNDDFILQSKEILTNQFKLSEKPCLSRLKVICKQNSEFNYIRLKYAVDILKTIGEEENLSINYIPTNTTSMNDDTSVVSLLTITSFMVFMGTGIDLQSAQLMAAYTALQYIIILLEE